LERRCSMVAMVFGYRWKCSCVALLEQRASSLIWYVHVSAKL
jgi:hypothetical protein